MVMNDITHIDIQVVRNLLWSRLSEGRDLMKSATVTTDWKKKERAFQDKCKDALKLIDEGIKIKEGTVDDASNDKTANESNQGNRKADVQGNQG